MTKLYCKAETMARKVLESKLLFKPAKYDLKSLFRIRDALITLKEFGLEDKALLVETIRCIKQIGDQL